MRWLSLHLLTFLVVFQPGASGENILTQHNNIYRTGANLHETALTPALLREGRFGKLASLCVNGQIYAQPLAATGVEIEGHGVQDVVIVATMENNVYAFDATGANETAFWKTPLGPPVPYTEIPQGITTIGDTYNIRQWIGITSTPVIDLETHRLFATAKIKRADGSIVYRLFALSLGDGKILQSVDIPGDPDFAFRHLQRPGLLLSHGMLYLAFGAHQDPPDQTGWVMAFSAATLERKYVFQTTPGGNGGGIWQAGNGLAADDQGNIYLTTGNGAYNQKDQFGDCFLKLSPELKVLSWFSPPNNAKLNAIDLDLGSAGPLLIPGTSLLVGGGKEGKFFLLNQDDLGTTHAPLQVFRATPGWRLTWTSWIPGLWNEGYHHIHGSPVYWNSAQGAFAYVWGEEDNLKAFHFDPQSHFNPHPLKSKQQAAEGMPGGILSLSADGDRGGVLWSNMPLSEDAFIATVRGVLRAFDATTLEELWNTADADPDDNFSFAKFCPPSIANGKVYLATFSDRLNIYGVKPAVSRPVKPADRKQARKRHKHGVHAERQ